MPGTKDDLIGELADRLGDESLAVLEELRGALVEPMSRVRRLDPALWGPAPDADEVRAAAAANAVRLARERVGVAADALSREDVAELLGVSSQAVSNRIRAGQLVAIRAGRRWLLPVWQFDPGSTDPVLPGVTDLLAGWPGSPVALSRWATTPSRDLDG
ncbi:MAG: helix-turn-helix domain-containing protein, partial [Egibacteraceae bacterium]